MIPPNEGFSLSQDSSPNRTPGDNFYISGYEGPNKINKDGPEWAWTLISIVQVLDPEDKTVTCGSSYNFAMLNSLETDHLGRMLISPNW